MSDIDRAYLLSRALTAVCMMPDSVLELEAPLLEAKAGLRLPLGGHCPEHSEHREPKILRGATPE